MSKEPIAFDVTPEISAALAKLAGDRKVRLSGQIRNGKLVIDTAGFAEEGKPFANHSFVAVNAPFKSAGCGVAA